MEHRTGERVRPVGLIALVVIVAIVDGITGFWQALVCGIGENSPQETVRFCDARLYELPWIGLVATVGGGLLWPLTRNRWFALLGAGLGVLFAFSVWATHDPDALRLVRTGGLLVAVPLFIAAIVGTSRERGWSVVVGPALCAFLAFTWWTIDQTVRFYGLLAAAVVSIALLVLIARDHVTRE